ncbi:MAG TPA: hypothetical protein VFB99_03865 [Vicinamibacterales bacterium]|nr:hypothetical protein [Vicinamibacterales bacterium]
MRQVLFSSARRRVLRVEAIVTGGSGYVGTDTITLAGGTFTTAAVLTVATVSGGAVTSVTVTTQGVYTDSAPVVYTQSATSGSGTGATFRLVFEEFDSLPLATEAINGYNWIAPDNTLIAGDTTTFPAGIWHNFYPGDAMGARLGLTIDTVALGTVTAANSIVRGVALAQRSREDGVRMEALFAGALSKNANDMLAQFGSHFLTLYRSQPGQNAIYANTRDATSDIGFVFDVFGTTPVVGSFRNQEIEVGHQLTIHQTGTAVTAPAPYVFSDRGVNLSVYGVYRVWFALAIFNTAALTGAGLQTSMRLTLALVK